MVGGEDGVVRHVLRHDIPDGGLAGVAHLAARHLPRLLALVVAESPHPLQQARPDLGEPEA